MASFDLPFVEQNKSRHGKIRYYFRCGRKRVRRLPDDPKSSEFLQVYQALRKKYEGNPTASAESQKSGTFGELCKAYLQSHSFKTLDNLTQRKRRKIIDNMLFEPLTSHPGETKLFHQIPLALFGPQHVEVLRDRKSEVPFAADERLKVLRQICETKKPGSADRFLDDNPARHVAPFRIKTFGHETMQPGEALQFIKHHGAGSKAVLALAILMYTGMRVSDLQQIGPQHRKGGEFRFVMVKNRGKHPTELMVPIHPFLEAVLDSHPLQGMAYMLTEWGKSYSVKGLGQRISEWFAQAGLPHLTAHSVRKGLATNLAHLEATDKMLDGLFGWKDGKTSKIYTAKAEQARLAKAAVAKINWGNLGSDWLHLENSGHTVGHTTSGGAKIIPIKSKM